MSRTFLVPEGWQPKDAKLPAETLVLLDEPPFEIRNGVRLLRVRLEAPPFMRAIGWVRRLGRKIGVGAALLVVLSVSGCGLMREAGAGAAAGAAASVAEQAGAGPVDSTPPAGAGFPWEIGYIIGGALAGWIGGEVRGSRKRKAS